MDCAVTIEGENTKANGGVCDKVWNIDIPDTEDKGEG